MDSHIDLSIYKRKNAKSVVKFVNNSPYIHIQIALKARINSNDKEPIKLDSSQIKKIEEAVNMYIQENTYNFLYKTSTSFNSDICSFGKHAVSKFYTESEWENYNWLENYKNSIFKVNVDTQVVSSMLLTEF